MLSGAITRALTLIREAGEALSTAGQSLTGLSGALADVVATMAAMPEVLDEYEYIEAQADVERPQPSMRTYDVDLPTSGSTVVGDEVGARSRAGG